LAEATNALVSLMLRGVGFAVNLRFLREAAALLPLADLPAVFAAEALPGVLPGAGFAVEDFAAVLLLACSLRAVLLLEVEALCPEARSSVARTGTAIASAQTTASGTLAQRLNPTSWRNRPTTQL
jgi:hypothetical protein